MILPDIKLNIDPKVAIYSVTGICAVGTFILMGYLMGLQPKEVVCKPYIEELATSSTHIKELELEASKSKDRYLNECIVREKEICSDLVKKTTEGLRKLRCKICQSKGVR